MCLSQYWEFEKKVTVSIAFKQRFSLKWTGIAQSESPLFCLTILGTKVSGIYFLVKIRADPDHFLRVSITICVFMHTGKGRSGDT